MANVKLLNWQQRIAIGRESTYGSVPAMNRYIGDESAKFDYKLDSYYKSQVGGGRSVSQMYKSTALLTPSVTIAVQPDNCGEIFCSFFGTWTDGTQTPNAAGTQYKHTFLPAGTISDNFASVAFKNDYGQGTVYDYFGCRANKLNITVNPKEILKMSADFIGQREVAGTSAPVAIIFGTWQPWDFTDMNIWLGPQGTYGGTVMDGISALNISLDNAMSDGFRLGSQVYTTRPLPGGPMVNTVKFTNEYSGTDRTNYYTSGSQAGMLVQFTGQTIGGTGKSELWMRFPCVDYTTAPFSPEKDGLLCLAITARMLEGGTSFAGTGYSCQFELYNNINAY